MKLENSQLLRFTTAGSVDDGKSTLIGRLLYDSKSIFEDQLESIEKTSHKKGHQGVDLALFTDGLKDEREQGFFDTRLGVAVSGGLPARVGRCWHADRARLDFARSGGRARRSCLNAGYPGGREPGANGPA